MKEAREVSFIDFLKQINVITTESYIKNDLRHCSEEEISEKTGLDSSFLSEYKKLWEQIPQTQLSYIDLETTQILKEKQAKRFKIIVFSENENSYQVAAVDPTNEKMAMYLDNTLAKPVELFIANEEKTLGLIGQLYRKTKLIKKCADHVAGINTGNTEYTTISHLCGLILDDAIQLDATDIHFELNEDLFQYYFRIGHETSEKVRLPSVVANMLKQHIIIEANGDIAELKAPQDLSFKYASAETKKTVEIRVSILHSAAGYSTVLRVLKGEGNFFPLDTMFSNDYSYKVIKKFLNMSAGMCLVTGPTSSGKSTLLYSMLVDLASTGKKILTIEDPVEVRYPFLIQTQVEPKMGVGFMDIIRSSLRQNPDVLMIGEIRDAETGEMAIRTALTGTLAMSTLHTESAVKTIARLFDFGIEPFLLASAVRLILAVRLLRTICPYCKKEKELTEEEREQLSDNFPHFDNASLKSYYGEGCGLCEKTGLKGQVMISEELVIDEQARSLIIKGEVSAINEHLEAKIKGRKLGDNAIALFEKGVVPFSELLGVTTEL